MSEKKDIEVIEVVVLVTCWRRYPIGELCFKGLKRLQSFSSSLGIALKPLIVYSELHYQKLAEEFEFEHCQAQNKPLGEKHNIGLRYALENISFDYMMQIGSDDLLDNALMKLYLPYFKKKSPFFGLNSLYVVSFQTKETKTVICDHIFGAGRCIRRDVIESAANQVEIEWTETPTDKILSEKIQKGGKEWRPSVRASNKSNLYFQTGRKLLALWSKEINRGLDFNSQEQIFRVQRSIEMVKTPRPMVVDLKDGTNINTFDKFSEYDNGVFNHLLRFFPELKNF